MALPPPPVNSEISKNDPRSFLVRTWFMWFSILYQYLQSIPISSLFGFPNNANVALRGDGSWGIPANSNTTSALSTTGSSVVVSASSPPVAGQILVASTPTAAAWSNVPSSGTPLYSAKVPDLSQWTQFNFAGAAVTEGTVASGKTSAISLIGTVTAAGGDFLQGIYKTAPTPPYRIAVNYSRQHNIQAYQSAGIGFWTAGRLVVMGIGPSSSTGIFVSKFNSITSGASPVASVMWQEYALGDVWLGLYNDGTNIHYQYSADSINWITLYSEVLATGWLTGAYSNPMLFVDSTTNGEQVSLLCQCWDENGLSRTVVSAYG